MVFSVLKDDEVNLVFHYSCTIINVSQKELQHAVTQELQYRDHCANVRRIKELPEKCYPGLGNL